MILLRMDPRDNAPRSKSISHESTFGKHKSILLDVLSGSSIVYFHTFVIIATIKHIMHELYYVNHMYCIGSNSSSHC